MAEQPLNQSRVFSSSSLDDGAKHLQGQHVKLETSKEAKNIQAQLKDSLVVKI